jgi:ABC-2 type transport system permease protein
MNNFLTLLRHEIKVLRISPSTYIAAVLALLIMGFLYMATLFTLIAEAQEMMPPTLFLSTFWVPALLIVPMLTMRSLAEERRLGTLESLMTTPVNAGEVVLSKFLAAYGFYMTVWLVGLAYPWITTMVLQQPGLSERLLDPGALLGGYLFIALSGSLFVAVGIFASSLTRSQLVAGMLSFSIIFLMIVGIAALRLVQTQGLEWDGMPVAVMDYLQIFQHFDDFSRGIIDTRPLAYYLSGTALVLGLSVLVIEAKS